MPYISQDKRNALSEGATSDLNDLISSPGELNFLITMLIKKYLSSKGIDYQSMNDVMGALEGAKLEFYRKVVADFENYKESRNGSIY